MIQINNNSIDPRVPDIIQKCHEFFKPVKWYLNRLNILIDIKDNETNSGGAFKKDSNGIYEIYLGIGERRKGGLDYGDIYNILKHEVQHVEFMESELPDIHDLKWKNSVMTNEGLAEVQEYFEKNIKSPNYSETKYEKTLGVIHKTLGSFEGALQTLTDPNPANNNPVSANYLIDRDGKTVCLVLPHRAAWHAGNISNPSDRFKEVARKDFLGRYVNPNMYSVGIEFVCYSNENLTEAQIKKGREIFKILGISDIITHRDIASYKPNMEKDIIKFKDMFIKSKDPDDNRRWKIEEGKKYWLFDPNSRDVRGLKDDDFEEMDEKTIEDFPYGGAILYSNTDEPNY